MKAPACICCSPSVLSLEQHAEFGAVYLTRESEVVVLLLMQATSRAQGKVLGPPPTKAGTVRIYSYPTEGCMGWWENLAPFPLSSSQAGRDPADRAPLGTSVLVIQNSDLLCLEGEGSGL